MTRRVLRGVLAAASLVSLLGCAHPYSITVSPGEQGSTTRTVFVATQQRVTNAKEEEYADRTAALHYAQVDVAIPPNHRVGHIEHIYDPTRGFTMESYRPQARDGFVDALAAGPGDEIVIYVHGYNTTTTEAVFRFAQMGHDFAFNNTQALFSWDSAGVAAGYVYDRDSVLFARDDFADFLKAISAGSDKSITIVAHSLGAHLTMETMRQLAIARNTRVLDDIGAVVLLSPDIDPDIFRRQVGVIGDRESPYIILTNSSDQALALSSLLIGGRSKVGQLGVSDDIAELGTVIIDLTSMSSLAHMGHMVAVTAPSAIGLLRQLGEAGGLAGSGLVLD
ncbi:MULTISPECIES: alpha/beta hydrolase [Rhodobacterales]|uniref:alpha/beta hydrolase n=1 Tax=Rhodobacterales TaxID=204455 RepID=UPI0011BE2370|nr:MULTISPECIES: alpha/beta hydrolase [Rhodobacterales]MDO6589095.1 alpha/beta hydrolase [Yoonia sp. 1_MG-2023]